MEKKLIFIVDDSEIVSAIMERAIANMEHEVRKFSSGEEMLRNLHMHPNLILLDLNLEHGDGSMNGIDVIKEMEAKEAPVPVVILSGTLDEEKKKECREHGVEEFLSKHDDDIMDQTIAVVKRYF